MIGGWMTVVGGFLLWSIFVLLAGVSLTLYLSYKREPKAIRPVMWSRGMERPVIWPRDGTVWVGPFLFHEPIPGERGKDWETDADEVHYIHGYPIFYYKKCDNWRNRDKKIRAEDA